MPDWLPDKDAVCVFKGALVQAGMVQGLLEDNGINAYLADENANSMLLFLPVRVLVAKRDVDSAKPLLKELFEHYQQEDLGESPIL